MPAATVKKAALYASVPPEWPAELLPEIRAQVEAAGDKIVVLDDDPTGNQTVHGVTVVTELTARALTGAFMEPEPLLFVLTNTRSLPQDRAVALTREVVAQLRAARTATGRDFIVVSRSDSTLRGHYPAEVQALEEALESAVDGTLLIPFFLEGGRVTANNVHYVTEGEQLTPAGETEYARDSSFGYTASNLRAWVSEKHGGRIAPEDVAAISLEDVRVGGPAVVAEKLGHVSDGQVCVVNALSYRDLEVFVAGLLQAEAAGKRFVYRTAASFVRVRGGIAPRPLLTAAELGAPGRGGLIVAGSHVRKTTQQLEAVLALPHVRATEVDVRDLLNVERRGAAIARATAALQAALDAGQDAALYTSRQAITRHPRYTPLEVGEQVSAALVRIVQGLTVRPAWLIAKGGITASDLATAALDVRTARVLGQAIPGVPVWTLGPGSRWPGLVYVVFPGNVGDAQAVARMVQILRGTA